MLLLQSVHKPAIADQDALAKVYDAKDAGVQKLISYFFSLAV